MAQDVIMAINSGIPIHTGSVVVNAPRGIISSGIVNQYTNATRARSESVAATEAKVFGKYNNKFDDVTYYTA